MIGPSRGGAAEGTNTCAVRSWSEATAAHARGAQASAPASRMTARSRGANVLDTASDYSRISKESVNRRLLPGLLALLMTLSALPAAGQVALVVGAVRDRHGRPIEDATVRAIDGRGRLLGRGTTDDDGTFAIRASGVARVEVRCRYCRATSVRVVEGEAVVAIVPRYDALLEAAPSTFDLAALPYAHVESALGLRPFTLLVQSSYPYGGPYLSDRGLAPLGGLTLDAGVPNYDPVGHISPFLTIPAQYEQSVEIDGAAQAYRYGDRAGGGIAELEPFADGGSDEVALIGDDAIVRVQAGGAGLHAAFGSSSDALESRQRVDAAGGVTLGGDQTLAYGAGSMQDRAFANPDLAFGDALSFATAAWTATRAGFQANAALDRGAYGSNHDEYGESTVWSDAQLVASFRSRGEVPFFVDAATRLSDGYSDVRGLGGAWIAGTRRQTRLDAGFEISGSDVDVQAGMAALWIAQRGGGANAAGTNFATPSLVARFHPRGNVRLDLTQSASYGLPSFDAQYAYGGAPAVDAERNSLSAATLTYSDASRLNASFEAASQNVAGSAWGRIASEGLAATWQVAPTLALRAWSMHVTDTVRSMLPNAYVPGSADGLAPTTGALWLTYENAGAVRADAIYRRDLLDGMSFFHVDGDLSGPLRGSLRWYVGAGDRQRHGFLDVGLRSAP